jgi:pimeloyl-ACP methyl ester carboxylesterase
MFKLRAGHFVRVARLGEAARDAQVDGYPLVCLHGYPDSLQIWSKLAPLLADRRQVFAFDWPGLGRSSDWPGGSAPSDLAKQLGDILDELGLARVDLCGIDMGGQPALVFAAQPQPRVRKLIVMNSLVLGQAATSWEISLLRKLPLNRFLLLRCPRLVFKRALATLLPPGRILDREVESDFWSCFCQRSVREKVVQMCLDYERQLQLLPSLYPTIRCPTLVLWSEFDKHFPVVQGQQLAALIPNGKFEVLAGCRHWAPLTDAQAMADRLNAFLL